MIGPEAWMISNHPILHFKYHSLIARSCSKRACGWLQDPMRGRKEERTITSIFKSIELREKALLQTYPPNLAPEHCSRLIANCLALVCYNEYY
jgi:hypothetical protein